MNCELCGAFIDCTCRLHMYSYKNCLDGSFAKELHRLLSLLLPTPDASPGDSYSTAATAGRSKAYMYMWCCSVNRRLGLLLFLFLSTSQP